MAELGFRLRLRLVAQMLKNLSAMQETQVQSLSLEDPLEKGMATPSSKAVMLTVLSHGAGKGEPCTQDSQVHSLHVRSFIPGHSLGTCCWKNAECLKVKVAQSCPSLCDPMNSNVRGTLQARILERVAIPFSRGSSKSRDQTQVSHTTGRFFTSWATRAAGRRSLLGPRLQRSGFNELRETHNEVSWPRTSPLGVIILCFEESCSMQRSWLCYGYLLKMRIDSFGSSMARWGDPFYHNKSGSSGCEGMGHLFHVQ